MTDNNQSIIDEAKAAAESAAEYTKAFEAEFAKQTKTEPETNTAADAGKYTIDYALEQLEQVRCEAFAFAAETRERLAALKSGGPGDVGVQAAGQALAALIRGQEELYRSHTDFYIGMIKELRKEASAAAETRTQFMDFVAKCTVAADPGILLPDFAKIWETMNK